jgi:hypothetical protein
LLFYNLEQVVYILDQVRALEAEMLVRIKQQGLKVNPQILVVCFMRKNDDSFLYIINLLLIESLFMQEYGVDNDRSQGSYLMLKEPNAIRNWNQSLIPSTQKFYACLFRQIKESCVNGFLALTFILILRGLLRYAYLV